VPRAGTFNGVWGRRLDFSFWRRRGTGVLRAEQSRAREQPYEQAENDSQLAHSRHSMELPDDFAVLGFQQYTRTVGGIWARPAGLKPGAYRGRRSAIR
jgi:hypothetical protein